MGEAAGSRDCGEEMREREVAAEAEAEEGAATVVRWERFLPRVSLRVLLVESDDSTRHIIAALLRKCSYKVAAVGDGLKAWELLKGKSQNIDLILTEVDLPSISGFALLTLIMEHDICKTIPVIMMSSQDSVSTVYKCMLRGAADFLVKPVRINELRNLWQHVWRRQSASRNAPQEESEAQQKVETTAENNAVSSPSSGYVACVQRNKECIEKGSDAQSSCTKPDAEAEMVHGDNPYDLSHMEINSPEMDTNMLKVEQSLNLSQRKHDNKDNGLVVSCAQDVNSTIQEEEQATEGERKQANALCEPHNCDDAFASLSREAIDFIGAFNDHSNFNFRSSSVTNNKFDSSPMLDLSLRRSHPSESVNQATDDRQALNHSDSSAFSRYVNRVPQPLHSPSICNQRRDHRNISERHFTDHTFNYYSHNSSPLSSKKNTLSSTFPGRQQTVVSIPLPVKGVRIDGLSSTYGSVVSPVARKQSELSPLESPGSTHHQSNPETRKFQVYNSMDQSFNNSPKQAENYRRHKFDSSEDQRHFSSPTDQSASSSFCNGTGGHLNSIGFGNNGSVDQTAVCGSVVESGNSNGPTVFGTNYQRNVQREAALTKFRLKRKERCFEKKVRYESRKKLAEQRPRVKGQFVRQMPASLETDSQCGNSLDG